MTENERQQLNLRRLSFIVTVQFDVPVKDANVVCRNLQQVITSHANSNRLASHDESALTQ